MGFDWDAANVFENSFKIFACAINENETFVANAFPLFRIKFVSLPAPTPGAASL